MNIDSSPLEVKLGNDLPCLNYSIDKTLIKAV